MNPLFLALMFVWSVMAGTGHATESKKADSTSRAANLSLCLSMLESRGGKVAPIELDPEAKQEACSCFIDRAQADERIWALFESGARPDGIRDMGVVYADLMSCLADSVRKQVARLSVPVDRVSEGQLPWAPMTKRTGIARKEGDKCKINEYPEFARRQSAEGLSVVQFEVDPSGKVTKLRIARSSGDTLAHKLLDVQAANIIWQCRFVPATRNAEPESAWGSMEIEWKLR